MGGENLVKDAIKVVKDAEREASENIAKAIEQSKLNRAEIETKALENYNDIISKAKVEAEKILNQAKVEAEAQAVPIMEECESRKKSYLVLGTTKLEKAVNVIVERIVN